MKKFKNLFAAVLAVCVAGSMVSVPVMAEQGTELEVVEVTKWRSSDYLNPDNPVTENNPWSIEATTGGQWTAVTGTTSTTTSVPLFPTMPDEKAPTTGYIFTGDYSGKWSVDGVNLAVNGKYMVPGALWTSTTASDDNAASAKIAKVFTAPETGKIRISAAEGAILSNHSDYTGEDFGWIVSKSNETGMIEIWKKNSGDGKKNSQYDTIVFDNQYIDVTEGEKIYFILQPRKNYNSLKRSQQACIWDPIIAYTESVSETDSFLSSKYLDPDSKVVYDETNPWSVESTVSASGTWMPVTAIEPQEDVKALFPTMPDGQAPATGYITTRLGSGSNWEFGMNGAINGKYMVPGCRGQGDSGDALKTPAGKIAKVFTAPKDGIICISADGGAILSTSHNWEEWGSDATAALTWSVEKVNGSETDEIWSKRHGSKVAGASCEIVPFEDQYMNVTQGEKIYFILKSRANAVRAEQACIWDPQVDYLTGNVFGNATYADGTVTLDIMSVDAETAGSAKLIVGAYNADGTQLLGVAMQDCSAMSVTEDIKIENLDAAPAMVKAFIWDFGADGKGLELVEVAAERVIKTN